MRKFLCALLSLTVFSLVAAEITDAVLARVGDKVITSFDVRMEARNREALLPPGMSEQQRMEAVAAIRAQVLDDLLLEELVWMDFQELKAKIPMNYVQERINRIIQEQAGSSEERFRDMLHRENITYQEFQEKIIRQLAVEMLLYDRTKRNIFVTNEQIRLYFQEHRDEFATPSSFHLQAILLKREDGWQEKAKAIRQRLAQGEAFDLLAKECSQGANAQDGGDLGWMDSMVPELEGLIAEMLPGELAATDLEVGNNVYIVKLLEKQGGEAQELTPELQAKIKKILENQIAENRKREYLETLYTKYPVRRY